MDIMSMLDPTTSVSSAAAKRVASGLTAASTTTGGSTSTSSTADQGISSSDFLTLLVTEMKNQDPTQPTDPNAYIQQLVGVNSLQQLISINQELGSSATSTPGTTSGVMSSVAGS